MASISKLLVANVAEAGDMVLYAGLLVVTLVVGLVLFGIDSSLAVLTIAVPGDAIVDLVPSIREMVSDASRGTKRLGDEGGPEHLQSYNRDPCRRDGDVQNAGSVCPLDNCGRR